jgi:hypothetical protein
VRGTQGAGKAFYRTDIGDMFCAPGLPTKQQRANKAAMGEPPHWVNFNFVVSELKSVYISNT